MHQTTSCTIKCWWVPTLEEFIHFLA